MTESTIIFYYDISCPFAYLATTRIEAVAARSKSKLVWRPVLLGGIYEKTNAPQGKDGSAMDTYNDQKKAVLERDFKSTCKRYKMTISAPKGHPQKTTTALRLIYSFPNSQRGIVTKALFNAYWKEGANLHDRKMLLHVGLTSGAKGANELSETIFSYTELYKALSDATDEVVEHGSPGVPAFLVVGQKSKDLYWGLDRMFMVEAVATAASRGLNLEEVPSLLGLQPRCLRVPPVPRQRRQTRLDFYFDFASPWSYIGWTQLDRIKREAGTGLSVELKPVLLGGIFKAIGAPNVPVNAMSETKRRYFYKDLHDFCKYWDAVGKQSSPPQKPLPFRFPDSFPLNTVLAMRCMLVSPQIVPVVFKAIFQDNHNISDEEVLKQVLAESGFNVNDMFKKAKSDEIKNELRRRTEEAVKLGLCGVPSYQVWDRQRDKLVAHGNIVFGQDRSHVVQDLIAGWREDNSQLIADVSSMHKLGLVRKVRARV